MKSEIVRNIECFLEPPGGISYFRRFVVDLAIQGAFTPEVDRAACSKRLLERLRAEKLNLGLSNQRESPIRPEEIPFGDPSLFVRLSGLARLEKGEMGIQKANPGQYPLVTLAEARATCDRYQFDAKAAIVPLISSTGHGHASMKRLHYQEGKFALANILCAVVPFIPDLVSARFIFEYLTAYKELLLVSKMIGTANVSLTLGKIAATPVPLVCSAGQKRVEELMILCDELEKAQAKREARRDKLVTASLHRVSSAATDQTSFQESARFYFNQLPRLTTRPEHIQQLRHAVLELALQGRFTNKSQNFSREITEMSPFPLPATWAWRRIEEIATQVTDGEHATPVRIMEKEVPLITAKNVRDGAMDYSNTDWVSRETAEKAWQRCCPQPGDILLVCVGATTGRLCIFREHKDIVLVRSVALIRPNSEISVDFLGLALRSPFCQKQIWSRVKVSAQPCLYINRIKSLIIPLPPPEEQEDIVSRVTELIALCNEIESEILKGTRLRRSLLEAALQQGLASAESCSSVAARA